MWNFIYGRAAAGQFAGLHPDDEKGKSEDTNSQGEIDERGLDWPFWRDAKPDMMVGGVSKR
jgi:hypothetical protein